MNISEKLSLLQEGYSMEAIKSGNIIKEAFYDFKLDSFIESSSYDCNFVSELVLTESTFNILNESTVGETLKAAWQKVVKFIEYLISKGQEFINYIRSKFTKKDASKRINEIKEDIKDKGNDEPVNVRREYEEKPKSTKDTTPPKSTSDDSKPEENNKSSSNKSDDNKPQQKSIESNKNNHKSLPAPKSYNIPEFALNYNGELITIAQKLIAFEKNILSNAMMGKQTDTIKNSNFSSWDILFEDMRKAAFSNIPKPNGNIYHVSQYAKAIIEHYTGNVKSTNLTKSVVEKLIVTYENVTKDIAKFTEIEQSFLAIANSVKASMQRKLDDANVKTDKEDERMTIKIINSIQATDALLKAVMNVLSSISSNISHILNI